MSSVHSVVSQVIKPEQIRPTDSKHVVLVQEMNNNTASAKFVHPVPTVDYQVESAGVLFHKHPELTDNATEMFKGKQEQRQQQCHCCYICQHHGELKHPKKTCFMDVLHFL